MPITYTNKDKNAAVGSPERTWRDVDANEVKTVVNAVETAAATAQSDVDTHEARTDNPHAVTAAQVGSPTTSEMNSAIASALTGLWDDRGAFSAAGGAYPSTGGSGSAGAILKGDIWTISVAGTLPTGQVVGVGDTVRALVDTPGNTQANWAIAENNIGYVPENSASKDTANGYPGLSSWSIKFRNLANTFTSLIQNAATAVRTYIFPDKDGTVALTDDLSLVIPSSYTADGTLVLADSFINANKATAFNITVPPGVFPVNKYITVLQGGAGTVTFVAGAGVTITSSSGDLTTPGQNSVVQLFQISANVWRLSNGNNGTIVDWSNGIAPVGWSSFTVKQCYYIDYGKFIFIAGQISGTGDATTGAAAVSLVLPILPNATVYATMSGVFPSQVVSNVTVSLGEVSITGGSLSMVVNPAITGAGTWAANLARQVRFSFIYFR